MHPTNDQLIDYIHNALSPEEDASVHVHLDECATCREDYAAEVALGEFLRRQAKASERELPSTVKAAIWSEIRAARPQQFEWLRVLMRPLVAVPALAGLAVALYFGVPALHPQQVGTPAIEAAYYLDDHAAMNTTVPFSDRLGANPAALENETAVYADEAAVTVQPAVYTADVRH